MYENPTLKIGDNSSMMYDCSIIVNAPIDIGNNVLIASNVCFISGSHGHNPELEKPYSLQELEAEPITIDDGCWIGEKVIILQGVHIGKKCVITAGSVVTKDIPDYSMVGGSPAKVLRVWSFKESCWVKPK